MGWHLKDRDQEEKLQEFSGGTFLNALNYAIENRKNDTDIQVEFGRIADGDNPIFYVHKLALDDCEYRITYEPKSWNDFPEVIPPENVWMRFEDPVGDGYKVRFEEGEWLDVHNDIMKFDAGRYRPWED